MRFICLFLDTFFETQLLYGVVELVGIRYRTFGESVNLIQPNYHWISLWLVPTVGRETVNLHMVFLVHFVRHREWY